MKQLFIAALLTALSPAHAATPAPYAGQESRSIKALSPDEVADLLAGKGMGLAKAAELNGFPGPAHVLELSRELGLTDGQREKTKALFESMDASAKRIGAELVAAERDLDLLFKTRQVTPESLAAQLQRVASLQAQVRGTHLAAHLEQVKLLTATQIARYNDLRGYSGARPQQHKHGGKHQ